MKILRRVLILFFLLFSLLAGHAPAAYADVTSDLWRTEKSQHFIIYHQGVSEWYINKLISEAERYYNSILDDLGFRRFDFWSWEDRAKIYLHNDSDNYHTDTERVPWSGAMVHVGSRTIKTFVDQPHFFDSMLPHEMTHIIFREFIGERADLPLWIDEGVACSQEESTLTARIQMAKQLVKQNKYVDLNELSGIKRQITVSPQVFYSQAASLIVFLLDKYNKERFFEFCRQIRDGRDWIAALKSAYRFDDLDDMQEEWKNYMLRS